MNRFRKQITEAKPPDAAPPAKPTPLRQYKDDSQGTVPSKLLFRLGVTAYWLVPLLIFAVILAGGVYLAFKFDLFTDEFALAEQPPEFIGDAGEIIIPKLLEHYLTAVGGRKQLESVQSVRYKGLLREASGEVEFQILLSLPDKGMLIMDPGRGVRHRVVLNGRVAWQAIDYGDGTQKIVRMDEIDTASLMWSLRVHNTMRRLALEGSVADMTARKIVHEGEPAYALSKPMPDGSVFEAVLDAATLYLLRSEENVPGKEGMERLEVIYGEHRMVSGIVEPYRSTTYKNGLMFNEVLLESVDRDPGLMSSLFEVPEELLK